jgi:hypothetical protein
MTCTEESILMVVNKATFKSVFMNNRSKLAEIKIRMLGESVTLDYILMHPQGLKNTMLSLSWIQPINLFPTLFSLALILSIHRHILPDPSP